MASEHVVAVGGLKTAARGDASDELAVRPVKLLPGGLVTALGPAEKRGIDRRLARGVAGRTVDAVAANRSEQDGAQCGARDEDEHDPSAGSVERHVVLPVEGSTGLFRKKHGFG